MLDFVSLFLGSEVMAPSPIKLVPVSSSSSTTLCLYSGAEQSLCDMLKPVAGKVGVDLMQLSLVCDGEEKVKEALRAGCWVVLEHTECIGNGWQRSLQQIMEVCVAMCTHDHTYYYCCYRVNRTLLDHNVTSGYHYH